MAMINDNGIFIDRLTLGPYETNAYIAVCLETKESLIVDAPARASVIIASLKGTKPRYILLTHDHFDHTGVITSLRSRLKVPLVAHSLDSLQLKTPPEITMEDGDRLKLGKLEIRVLHTPGHTPGGLCFVIGQYVFVGDTIFPGGPGHTETPDDFQQILKSITEKIFSLPDDTILFPGHGDNTTVKKAKEEYAAFASRPHDPDICGDVTWLM
ncbi:MAG: MBL fold metallo-hydrolase [Dehalococcoidales bacterium]|nr:MBL fold metallo-hydrolase [Dehalococcoidales bacterium]